MLKNHQMQELKDKIFPTKCWFKEI